MEKLIYQCEDRGLRFEATGLVDVEDDPIACPRCEGLDIQLVDEPDDRGLAAWTAARLAANVSRRRLLAPAITDSARDPAPGRSAPRQACRSSPRPV